jgi:hypothetical protein
MPSDATALPCSSPLQTNQHKRTWKGSTGFALASVGLLATGDEKDGGVEAEGRLQGGGGGEGISF